MPILLLILLISYISISPMPATASPSQQAISQIPSEFSSCRETLVSVQPHNVLLPVALKEAAGPDQAGLTMANLIANGSFEAGNLDGWNGGGVASMSDAYGGNWSAHLENNNLETIISTNPGATYKVTGWVKIVSETGDDWGGFRLEVFSWDWESLTDSGLLLLDSHGDEWFKVALTFTASTEQTRLDIGYFGGPGRGMVVHVDDIMAFEKGENLAPNISSVSLDPSSMGNLSQMQSYGITGDDPDGAIVRVLWDFGDGGRSLSRSGMRRAALPGSFTARVYAADDEGLLAVETINWTAISNDFPGLVINTPAADYSTTSTPRFTISGAATGSIETVVVSSNRGYVGTATGTGTWEAEIIIQPGDNCILVQAHDADGQIATAERLVRYLPDEPLQISNISENSTSVERWELLEINFSLENSAATHPQFPYESNPAPGLHWIDGVTVDALFTPDDWQTVYRRPAFLNQPYDRDLRSDQEWLYPIGTPIWTVRFAPPELGAWKYRLEAREAKGTARSPDRTFAVTSPTNPNNHGPIRLAAQDSRYFEFVDETLFLGTGHGIGFSDELYSYHASELFDEIGSGNQHFFRWWISGSIWGSAWQPWASRTLPYDGTVPATGLTLERNYGNGLGSLRLDEANPIMFQGFASGHPDLIPGRSYRMLVRWRTEEITGPSTAGQPYGLTVKLTGWPELGGTAAYPALISHVQGDTPWHIAQADFVADEDLIDYITISLENSTSGAGYVDEIGLYELLGDGALGPQLLRSPRFNTHLTFDPHRGAGMDAILAEAAERGFYFKLVISEKQEYLLNHLAPDGLPDKNGGYFNGDAGSPTRSLHEYYWRHLFARFGAFRSIHSWELVNEESPSPGDHFQLATTLAVQAAADGNPHLATTSTWATLAEDAWSHSENMPISYVDFHAYARGTGWIEPRNELARDSARFFHEYDLAARAANFNKPVVWGEQGIDGNQSTDIEEPLLDNDQNGVWLHKLTWARTGPGGVYPIYWYTDRIFDKKLHSIFGAWNRFMAGIPLNNGRYEDVATTTPQANLRIIGQKDLQAGNAHLWIDNRQHIWHNVVDGVSIPVVSGTINIPMQRSNAAFDATWYSTDTGQPTHTEPLTSDNDGILTLTISNLATDIAVKIALVN